MEDSYIPKRNYTKKVKLSQILKPGYTAKDLQYNSENIDPIKVEKLIEKTRKLQRKILKD